jgi:hypothetical protein
MAEKPLTLSNREILNLHEGLSALDGVVDRAGSNTEVTRFTFDDKLSWNIAKNLDIVERATVLYQKARKSAAGKLGVVPGMKVTPENAANVAKYQEAEDALLEKTQDLVGTLRLTRSQLQSGNKIPPSVLKNLMPLLAEA